MASLYDTLMNFPFLQFYYAIKLKKSEPPQLEPSQQEPPQIEPPQLESPQIELPQPNPSQLQGIYLLYHIFTLF